MEINDITFKILPKEVKDILNTWDDNQELYSECRRIEKELNVLGYEVDYDLSGTITDIQKKPVGTNLYYTIEKHTDDSNEAQCLTGLKTITVYEIIDNKPELWFDIEVSNEANSKEEIINWLNDNGYGEKNYNLTIL